MSNLRAGRAPPRRAELWLAPRRVSQGNLNSDELPQCSRAWRPAADGWHSGYHKVTGIAAPAAGGAGQASGAGEGGQPSGLLKTGRLVANRTGQSPVKRGQAPGRVTRGGGRASQHCSCRGTGNPSIEEAGWGRIPGKTLTSLEQMPHLQESYGQARELVVTGTGRSCGSPHWGGALGA